jgi:hypothetical protein
MFIERVFTLTFTALIHTWNQENFRDPTYDEKEENKGIPI